MRRRGPGDVEKEVLSRSQVRIRESLTGKDPGEPIKRRKLPVRGIVRGWNTPSEKLHKEVPQWEQEFIEGEETGRRAGR